MIRRKKTSHMNTAKAASSRITGAMWTTGSSVFHAQKAGWECALKLADTEINSEGSKG
jgi:hypothetical protein